jgi:aromatic ring hydroxylase
MKKYMLFLAVLFQVSSSFAAPCAQPNEMQAIRIRALQTELMMAGLSCNGRKHYSHFVNNYKSELKQYANAMRSYFKRAYGNSGETKMNQFVTQLANESSTRSIKRGAEEFCDNAREWFDAVEEKDNLQNVAYSYRGDIRECN